MQRAGVPLLVLVGMLAACGPTPQASTVSGAPATSTAPSTEPSRSSDATPSVAPSVAPTESTAPAGWSAVGEFGTDGGIEVANAVAASDFGLIAVGVGYASTELQVFGPNEQAGRIWRSDDGREWEDVTPDETFAGAALTQVVAAPGRVLALGLATEEGRHENVTRAWETRDGTAWEPVTLEVGEHAPSLIVGGEAGYLVATSNPAGGGELWHAAEAWAFERVHSLSDGTWLSVGAGPEGFVAVLVPTTEGGAPSVMASADGVEWIDADPSPPIHFVAGVGPDWVGVDSGPGYDGGQEETSTPSWHSANGLEWAEAGTVPLRPVQIAEDTWCGEIIAHLIRVGDAVVTSTTLSYPCGEGGVQRFGRSHITTDGATWELLPFTDRELTVESDSRGTTVNAGIRIGDATLLVGESDWHATFWLRE